MYSSSYVYFIIVYFTAFSFFLFLFLLLHVPMSVYICASRSRFIQMSSEA